MRSTPGRAFAACVLALFLASLARGDDADFARTVSDTLANLRPGARAAGSIGIWSDLDLYLGSGWIDPSTFRGPFGMKLDQSCLAAEGVRYPQVPEKFILAVKRMHEAVQQCARTRVLPATVGLIYDRMPQTTLRCDKSACASTPKAVACAPHGSTGIVWRDLGDYANPSTIFHELLHRTRHVDNQETDDHNDWSLYPFRDEVYFWENHCFHLPALVGKMREALRREIRERGLSLDSRDDLKKVYQLAFDVCATPFNYNAQPSRPVFNAREVEAVCRPYAQYLMMEINMRRAVASTLMPLSLDCDPLRDHIACPRPELFDPGSPAAKRLAAHGIVLPPNPGQYSPEKFSAWAAGNCPKASAQDAADDPASSLAVCAQSQSKSLDALENLAGFDLIDLKYPEVSGLREFFSVTASKARAVAEGPGRFRDFAEKGFEEGAARGYLSAVLSQCSKPEIKDSRLCAELGPDGPTVRLMVLMLLHWQPKTLPR